ncbi:hypothetical protein OSB04_016303 [Centaurea solstitialis]|uniref:TIR domain-containing protein n=1 Tax=Centaurea solstitialis TaxID=347529 RepID=A0AA38T8E3_9ASTR|nr:hypothetical protein OSB04_016303 [Centaurea solstitialis]
MESSSTSSIPKTTFKYDVFLSFRGEDTRTSFVDHLYHAFKLENVEIYKDDENLERGKKINKELIQAIEDSRFHVIVFSKNYASSSWCLDELVKIIECQETSAEHTVYPIFYDVEPTQVRKQSGEFGRAFSKHENDEAAEKWRKALVEATSFSGKDLTVDRYEVEFIKKVVKEISLKLPSISVDENLIGMRTRINGVVSSLNAFPDEFCMIGIKGMGGIGKTTLSRAVFDQISFQFEGKSFVANVREVSKPDFSGLNKLQQQVLRDVSNDQDITINNVFDGKNMMKKKMPGRKVLVVLDDVDHIEQLKALAGEPNWFNPGSKIIITTRDKQVCIWDRDSKSGYKELSEKVVSYAAGLPLTITILGSTLFGETEHVWKDTLKELEKIPLDGTLQRLELSYKGLDTNCQEIFLDVACILKGWEKEKAIGVLESFGFHAIRGLSVLEKKSLVTTRNGFLEMHDHIEEMGRYIVRRLHLEEPKEHSRLWIKEEIEDILASDHGTNEAIRCIKLITSKINPELVMKGLGNMKQLRFLQVFARDCSLKNWKFKEDEDCYDNNWEFDEVCTYFPNALRWLSWKGYPFRSLPKSFQANNLVSLEMSDSKIVQLWEHGDRKVLNKLKFLDLQNSQLKSLDLSLTSNLERLCLYGCYDLVELYMPVEYPKLISLELSNSKLTTLDLRGAPNLVKLHLNTCDDLVELHMPVECPKLGSVYICGSKLRTLDLRGTLNLENLYLEECDDLVELQIPVECLKLEPVAIHGSKLRTLDLQGTPNIKRLHLKDCFGMVELHIPVECRKLKSINIDSSKLRTLDLRGSLNIERLHLKNCFDMVELHIPVECPKLNSIDIDGSGLRTLDLRGTLNIVTLHLKQCVDLVELHIPVECLTLASIDINGSKLKTFDLPLNLEELHLVECVDLVELAISVECLKLKYIYIDSSKLKTLDLRGTPNIENLHLEECVDLVELHIPVECLKLKSICINGSKLRTLDLGGTPNIEKLQIKECVDLVELHIPVECLKLKSIYIRGSKLRTLDLRKAPNVETLRVRGCYDLVELHFHVECLKLEFINIKGAKLRTFGLGLTPDLKILSLTECFYLVELHAPFECLKKLSYLELSGCLRFKSFLCKERFESLEVGCLSKLHLIAESLDMCPLHSDNSLPKFRFGCSYEEYMVPSLIGNLAKLLSTGLCACIDLERFSQDICGLQHLTKLTLEGDIPEAPNDLGKLECLLELSVSTTMITHLPESICMLKHLKILKLQSCWHLEKLPEDLGELESLEDLTLSGCRVLRDIPNSVCKMKRLENLNLLYCFLVEKLPKEIGRLECLKVLNIEGPAFRRLAERKDDALFTCHNELDVHACFMANQRGMDLQPGREASVAVSSSQESQFGDGGHSGGGSGGGGLGGGGGGGGQGGGGGGLGGDDGGGDGLDGDGCGLGGGLDGDGCGLGGDGGGLGGDGDGVGGLGGDDGGLGGIGGDGDGGGGLGGDDAVAMVVAVAAAVVRGWSRRWGGGGSGSG